MFVDESRKRRSPGTESDPVQYYKAADRDMLNEMRPKHDSGPEIMPDVGPPHVKPIDGPLWEIRLKGRSGIARALYVAVNPERVVIVRVFQKKTQKTPHREIRLAQQRAKELEQ